MTDTSAYVNAYIDTTINMLHENLSTLLQLKTQAKLSNELIKAKNDEIVKLQEELKKAKENCLEELEKVKTDLDTSKSDLQNKLNSTRSELEKTKTIDNEEINKARADARKWEEEYNNIKGKQGLVDTLTNQFNDVKKQLISKTQEYDNLNNQLSSITLELNQNKNLLLEKENKIKELEKQNVKRSSQPTVKKNINNKNTVDLEEKDDDF